MGSQSAFGEKIVAYCRECSLPLPTDTDSFSVSKDGVDLVLVDNKSASLATVWADLGLIKDYRNEEEILAKILSISLVLDPLKECFIGLDDSSRRLMFRSRFSLTDASLANTITQVSGQVRYWKGWLAEQRKLS